MKAFEDLTSIATYGFRGEALASISHIAHLRVTTKTAGSSCAWQAHYADGKLTPAKPGQSADPKPCAGRGGTQITVEDLFYNIPNRRRAFRSASEEYAKILDLVSKYSVHCSHVAFSIKKQGDSGAGFSISASASTLDRIKQTNGTAVGKEIVAFTCEDRRWGVKATGYASNANYNGKRTMLLLFINHRSVESSAIKKALEQTYTIFLPKGGKPFVYLSLEIDPARVDVNVHPTKREVHFLNEDEIIEVVCTEIREKLAQVDTSRTFKTQTLLPGMTPATIADVSKEPGCSSARGEDMYPPKTPATKKPYENNLIRTDSSMRKITSMLPPVLTPHQSLDNDQPQPMDGLHYETVDREQTQIRLTSIKNLRATVRDSMHNNLTEVFAALTYIGLVDAHRRLIAMQSGVKLFLVDYGMASNEFFYQIGLTDFGNFGRIELNPPPLLTDLLSIAAKHELANSPDLDPDTVMTSVHKQIISRKAMLSEYFSIELDDTGHLLSIPLLLKGYKPSLAKLPIFLLRLGPFVDWTDEQACFHSFLVELASFYVPEQLPVKGGKEEAEGESEALKQRRKELAFMLEHVLFPAMRSRLVATKGLLAGVVEVANLKGLYRVFERC